MMIQLLGQRLQLLVAQVKVYLNVYLISMMGISQTLIMKSSTIGQLTSVKMDGSHH